ncbi:hypothetical protein D3C76_28280 [compost metagenome]
MSQEAIDLNEYQIELEKIYNKNQLMKRIREEFENCEDFDFKKYMAAQKIDPKFGIDLLAQMALHKRCDLPTLVGVLQRHFLTAQDCADALDKACEADLVDWEMTSKMFIVKFTIGQEVQEELDRFQFPLPLVVPPRKVECNLDTGMYTSDGSIILKKNHHDDDVCLDHINRVNQIAFKIDWRVATMVKNQWRNLDKPKAGETREDFLKRKKAFEKYDRTAHDVMNIITQHTDQFHLTHKYCKRGRTYCQGYHVNYQGTAWNKAVINFANEEMVE